MLNKLYKFTKTGATQEWQVYWDTDDNGAYYEVEFGQKDGAKQTKRNYVKGKNIGKSNKTTPLQQAVLEAKSKYNKQKDKGYSEGIELSFNGKNQIVQTTFRLNPRPMLAHDYKDHLKKVEFPAYIQPKLDGIRCIASREYEEVGIGGCKLGRVVLRSRNGKEFTLPHITNELEKILSGDREKESLDGELYINGTPFQTITSLVKKHQPGTENVEFHVYDVANEQLNFSRRFALDNTWISGYNRIKVVETHEVQSHEEIQGKHIDFTGRGYEGSIVRLNNYKYEIGARSYSLLKVKDFLTEEFEIVGVEQNEHKPDECSLIHRTVDGHVFNSKPTGTTEYRESVLKNKDGIIGKMGTVKFFEWTSSEKSVPRFPVTISISRDYE